jgi:hypothetical protein
MSINNVVAVDGLLAAFGVGQDVSTALAAYAILLDGDIGALTVKMTPPDCIVQ